MKLEFYNANLQYIDYLKKYETSQRGKTCVPNVQYASNNKFFYGAVLQVKGVNYFVPVSHQIHRKQDDLLIKIKSKSKPIVGTLRFAYMIPIPSEMLSLLRRDEIPDRNRQELVRKELAFCRKNKDKIEKMAKSAYSRIISKCSRELSENSCDFVLLERAYILFCKEHGIQVPKELQQAHPEMLLDAERAIV